MTEKTQIKEAAGQGTVLEEAPKANLTIVGKPEEQKQHSTISLDAIENVLIFGDLKLLTQEQRLQYYRTLCARTGLDPMLQPFEYIDLPIYNDEGKKIGSKLILYAKATASNQLRRIHKISVRIRDRFRDGDLYTVVAAARTPDGREDESIGAVSLGKLYGKRLGNAVMTAETKAKRRVTLSMTGLGMPDESEVKDLLLEEASGKEQLEAGLQEWAQPVERVIQWVYRIPDPKVEQIVWMGRNGLVQDKESGLWVSSKRISALDKFELKPEPPHAPEDINNGGEDE